MEKICIMATQNIAFLFYGHLRSFKETFKNFKKNVLEANKGIKIDIFIHTWDELEHTGIRKQYIKDLNIAGKPITEKDINFIIDNYKPISYKVDSQLQIDEIDCSKLVQAGYNPTHYEVTYNVSYAMQEVNKLRRESGRSYDFIVLTRMDIDFIKPLNLIKLYQRDKSIHPQLLFSRDELDNTVFYSYMETPDLIRNQNNYITGIDLLLITSEKVMDVIGNWHKKVLTQPPKGIEGALTRIINENNFSYQLMYYKKPDCFNILRTNNSIGLKIDKFPAVIKELDSKWDFDMLTNKYQEIMDDNPIYLFSYLRYLLDIGKINACVKIIDGKGVGFTKQLVSQSVYSEYQENVGHIINILFNKLGKGNEPTDILFNYIMLNDGISIMNYLYKNRNIFSINDGLLQMVVQAGMDVMFNQEIVLDRDFLESSLELYTQSSVINNMRRRYYLKKFIDYIFDFNVELSIDVLCSIEKTISQYDKDIGMAFSLNKLLKLKDKYHA